MGIACSLALITGVVFWLFQRVNEETQWAEFVRESSDLLIETAVLLEEAEDTLGLARSLGLAGELIADLEDAMVTTTDAMHKAEALSRFVVPLEDDPRGGDQSGSEDSSTPWAELDLLANLDHGTEETIVYPEQGRSTVDYFHDLVGVVEQKAGDLALADEAIKIAMQETLSTALAQWQVAVDELGEANDQAFAAMQSLSMSWIPEDEWDAVWNEYRNSRGVLAEGRLVDQTDVLKLQETTAQLREALSRIQEAVSPYSSQDEEP